MKIRTWISQLQLESIDAEFFVMREKRIYIIK